jgi:uncharacterized protein YndB with AHSA1/START domain
MQNKKELILEKVINAPSKSVWKAWTDPDMLKQWWGPDNVTIPECEVDLRVGGKFYIVMEAGEAMGPYKGTKWPMQAEFTVVEPTSKLSYDAEAWTLGLEKETTIEQTTEITLTDEKDKTKISIKAVIHKVGPKAEMAVQGMEAGFTQQLAKLDKFLGGNK